MYQNQDDLFHQYTLIKLKILSTAAFVPDRHTQHFLYIFQRNITNIPVHLSSTGIFFVTQYFICCSIMPLTSSHSSNNEFSLKADRGIPYWDKHPKGSGRLCENQDCSGKTGTVTLLHPATLEIQGSCIILVQNMGYQALSEGSINEISTINMWMFCCSPCFSINCVPPQGDNPTLSSTPMQCFVWKREKFRCRRTVLYVKLHPTTEQLLLLLVEQRSHFSSISIVTFSLCYCIVHNKTRGFHKQIHGIAARAH